MSEKRCSACPHAYECGKLQSALDVMAAMVRSSDEVVLKAMQRSFHFKLGMYGYDFGGKFHRCSPALKRDMIRSLTHEAIEVLDSMTIRNRKSKKVRELEPVAI